MKSAHWFLVGVSLLIAACTHDVTEGKKPLSVVEWATEMALADRADTIQEKFDVVVDTDDPHAFDGVIQIAKDQAAAEAAADN